MVRSRVLSYPLRMRSGAVTAALLLCAAAASHVSSQAPSPKAKFGPGPGESPVRLIRTDTAAGLEQWHTWLGPFWVAKPGEELLRFLQWEQVIQKCYSHPHAQVLPGDVVIDCGAHVGVFTRVALEKGARLVVAVEPEKTNRAAFARNFAAELRSGTVRLVAQGVWDRVGTLPLRLSTVNSGSHSLVFDKDVSGVENISVTTLDLLANAEKLPRVDFIKMDIEGAERQALRGAREVLRRWRPRMAIASYHLKDDPAVISAVVWEQRPDYRIASKDLELPRHGTIVPKVLFFY